VLAEHASAAVDSPERLQPLAEPTEALFAVEGDDAAALIAGLERLSIHAEADLPITELARRWYAERAAPECGRAVVVVARDPVELRNLAAEARTALAQDPGRPLPLAALPVDAARDRLFYSPDPLGREGRVAFVYPGSGNDYPGMGRDLGTRWPHVLRRQDAENRRLRGQYRPDCFRDSGARPTVRERIFAQVALGTLVTDLLASFGVRPGAAIGYSLGESAALFALRAWRGRDEMLARMEASPLFASDLTGRRDAARAAWRLPPHEDVDWVAGVVPCDPETVRPLVAGVPRAYLLIVNAPRECVLGGQRRAVEEVVARLGCPFLPLADTTTVHCPAARPVAEAYRDLHRLPTTPPGVRFYSTALGRAYDLNEDSAAEAILAQALDTVDFPAVVEQAYADGVRVFVEVGPGASCSRMIGTILGTRPHRARSVCVPGEDGVSSLLRVLAMLCAERVPFDREALFAPSPAAGRPAARAGKTITVAVGGDPFGVPPPPVRPAPAAAVMAPVGVVPSGGSRPRLALPVDAVLPVLTRAVAVEVARADAHAAYLHFAADVERQFAGTLAFQTTLLEALVAASHSPRLAGGEVPPPASRGPCAPPRSLDRARCLEFAVGSIGRVLGPAFADIDAFPTRVRLPDEPLMLVDRILTIEGEPLSLTSGRVVTEHDIQPNAWYLDGGRIPTCIAVESGQADLFLSGFLGIDLRTRGLAVYRLLDAAVTFHRGLPGPGQTIRYDIHIDRFFRQGGTHLFRFRFVGSVDGEPLLTMTDGCAGFFGAAELAAGKGIVQTELDRRPQQGVVPEDAADLPPQEVTSFDDGQIEALRRGDLGAAFGPAFAGRTLGRGLRLPGGRMRLVHRVPHLDPAGGRFGVGLIRGEADIRPDDWFLTCHFVDDQVMPGTLMYECCLHTLRIFLLRLGWVSERDEAACEPVPGIASRLRCRGQVTAATKKVTYELTIKERGYRPEPYVIADALMYADGKPIVECGNMTLRLAGLTREELRETWGSAPHHIAHGLPGVDAYPRQAVGYVNGGTPPLYTRDHILAFAVGKPSKAYGEPYRVFDDGSRFIARMPGPPFSFVDRVVAVKGEPFKMAAGAEAVVEYDVPPDAWYFAAERQPLMPYAVLLEAVLQSCGWLAAYVGSALTSPADLRFRNLGGQAAQFAAVTPDSGTLTTHARLTRVSASGGMIIQGYDFELRDARRVVYKGDTVFGFFSAEALAQQAGIRDARVYEPTPDERRRGRSFDYPREAPFPGGMLALVDHVELVPDGGPHSLGLVLGSKRVVPDEWFFAAHFYQDPVQPGSLGLEAFVQLLKVAAHARWPDRTRHGFLPVLGPPHRWTYRGQVVPTSGVVTTQAVVTEVDDAAGRLQADGWLSVDGKPIYRMDGFTLSLAQGGSLS
jgi:3-hydroxymyristoyl/3-hydroxydecanoyl-(acyl carrier protein) dehydratase/malonyl CoA-acyl carrier protein transacylase